MKEILGLIEKYNNIVIVRHIGADPDALCSQIALKELIKINYPNKSVYAVGAVSSRYKYLPKLDKTPEENNGLLIVVDTPDKKRVDIKSMDGFDKTIKIDHHPFFERYCDIEYIDDKASSASEIILEFANSNNLLINEDIAKLVFMGMVSDTNRFLYSTTAKTFENAHKLLVDYDLDLKSLYENIFLRPLREIKLQGYIEQHLTVTENGLAYILISDDVIKELGVDVASGGNLINNFYNIEEVIVWVMISEDVKNNMYKFNIRSRGPVINKVAESYNGGGHKYASGARVYVKEDVDKLLNELDIVCKDYNMSKEVDHEDK